MVDSIGLVRPVKETTMNLEMKMHIADQNSLKQVLSLSFCKNSFKSLAETGNSGLSVFRSPRLEACSAGMVQGFGVPDELSGPDVTPMGKHILE